MCMWVLYRSRPTFLMIASCRGDTQGSTFLIGFLELCGLPMNFLSRKPFSRVLRVTSLVIFGAVALMRFCLTLVKNTYGFSALRDFARSEKFWKKNHTVG